MKKYISFLFTLVIIFILLRYPLVVKNGVHNGLLLWYKDVLPTLFPYLILAHISLGTNIITKVCASIPDKIVKFFPCSANGIFPLFAGIFLGFPIGSRICADMVIKGQLSKKEANLLCVASNHMSPAFLYGYVMTQVLNCTKFIPLTMLSLYLPGIISLYFLQKKTQITDVRKNIPKTNSKISLLELFDEANQVACKTMVKLAGTFVVFSILSQFIEQINFCPMWIKLLSISALEVTNGVQAITHGITDFFFQYLSIILCLSFGGISGVLQTAVMIAGSGLSLKYYTRKKLLLSAISTLIAAIGIFLCN